MKFFKGSFNCQASYTLSFPTKEKNYHPLKDCSIALEHFKQLSENMHANMIKVEKLTVCFSDINKCVTCTQNPLTTQEALHALKDKIYEFKLISA